ncbi:MAG: phosphoribosylglycinamide formyltransferase [Paracoccaceae bacterium]
MKLAVAILISGSGTNMVQLIKSMDDNHPAYPSVVISNNSDAPGLEKAQHLGVPTEIINENYIKDNNLEFEKELIKILKLYNVELICLAGFMKILSKKFINNFKDRILNIHPSLLPKYKGLNTHARVIASNDTIAGCSVHLVTPELDGGPVLAQTEVAIKKNETAESLASKVLIEEHVLYPKVLLNFSNQIRKLEV